MVDLELNDFLSVSEGGKMTYNEKKILGASGFPWKYLVIALVLLFMFLPSFRDVL